MAINEDRKIRASEFISVRNVMMAMSQDTGLSVGEVAGEFIFYFDKPGGNPVFYRQDPATLLMSESDGAFSKSILNSVVKHGRLDWPDVECISSSHLDTFGWNRRDIGTFLLVFMGHLPDCCSPDWAPSKLLNPQASDHCPDASSEFTHEVQRGFNGYSYSTPLLELQKAAIFEFYSHPRSVDPKKDEVVSWLFEAAKELDLALSNNVADAMFTIIKPKDHNPKNRRG